jgi:hypothetical protein
MHRAGERVALRRRPGHAVPHAPRDAREGGSWFFFFCLIFTLFSRRSFTFSARAHTAVGESVAGADLRRAERRAQQRVSSVFGTSFLVRNVCRIKSCIMFSVFATYCGRYNFSVFQIYLINLLLVL